MGPRVGGLGAERVPVVPPRWRDRLERSWGVPFPSPAPRLDVDLERCLDEWETGLSQIDLPEVTDEDRVTFLEHVVSWQVRRALLAGRFDLAVELRSRGARRVAELVEQRLGWRPVLIRGIRAPEPETGPPRLRA